MALTQEEIDSFWQNGFLACGKILTDEEIAVYRTEYDRVFEEANRTKTLRNLSAADDESVGDQKLPPQKMLQIINMFERSLLFAKLLYDSRILDRVQDLIGPNIMLFHDQALYKPARTGGAVFWHQDNAYWKCRPATLVSCWLTFDDVVRENGAMQVIPGSHLKPTWHDPAQTTDALLKTSVDESKAIVVDLPAGGCMFHHCQALHYTQPNTTDRQRRAFAIHFMQPGTRAAKSNGEIIKVDYHTPMLRMRI